MTAPLRILSAIGLIPLLATGVFSQDALYLVPGNEFEQQFGSEFDRLDDVDGDGKNDLLVKTVSEARVYQGANGALRYSVALPSIDSEVFGCGDLDGDGVGDWFALLPTTVDLHSGPDGHLLFTLNIDDYGCTDNCHFMEVHRLDDVNRDGHHDLLSVIKTRSSSGGGELYVLSGADGSVLWSMTDHIIGYYPFGGQACGTLGDRDGDGITDVWLHEYEGDDEFMAVYSGASGIEIARRRTVGFWHALDAGDLDHDTVTDIWILETFAYKDLVSAVSGSDGRTLFTQVIDKIGLTWIDRGGDFDGDGTEDLLYGQPAVSNPWGVGRDGFVHLISGSDGRIIYTAHGALEDYALAFDWGEGFATTGRGMNDLDGDGYADFAIGAPGADLGPLLDAGAIFVLGGNDLFARLSGKYFVEGDELTLTVGRQVPGSPVALVITSNLAYPLSYVLPVGQLDSSGFLSLSATVSAGVAGFTGSVQAFCLTPARTLHDSACEIFVIHD